MDALLKKLNYKDQKVIHVLNAPAEFQGQLAAFALYAQVNNDPDQLGEAVEFAIVFATKQTEVDAFARLICPRMQGDAMLWVCYPKGSSKRYKCDFNRDTGWAELGKQGLEPVRQVALDEDWSTLRFRKVQYIKTMTRSFAMTEAGKAKTGR
jgi:hypothetical protein